MECERHLHVSDNQGLKMRRYLLLHYGKCSIKCFVSVPYSDSSCVSIVLYHEHFIIITNHVHVVLQSINMVYVEH